MLIFVSLLKSVFHLVIAYFIFIRFLVVMSLFGDVVLFGLNFRLF